MTDHMPAADAAEIEPGFTYVQIAVRVPVALASDSDVLGYIAEAAQDYVNETYHRL